MALTLTMMNLIVEILQGLGVNPGSATERWPYRKNAWKKKLPEKNFTHGSFPEVGEKQKAYKKKKKVGENNGQLRLRPPPRVAHASRLDQHTSLVTWSEI